MQFLDALFGKTQRSKFLVATALLGGSVFGLVGGCATPFYSTDNKFLLHFPGAARRSDQIPGVLRPWERIKLIEEKGEKGAKAPAEEKDVLLLQLSEEFEKSTSPNIRRSSIEAIAKISRNYSNPVAENIFRVALEDNELNIALSAADGLGVYALDVKGGAPESRRLAAELLADKYKRLPFCILLLRHKASESLPMNRTPLIMCDQYGMLFFLVSYYVLFSVYSNYDFIIIIQLI